MPQPSLRHESKPANIITSEDAGHLTNVKTASPTSYLPLDQVLTPHMHPRPRSSWYSQPSVAYSPGFKNPWNAPDFPPPPVPNLAQGHNTLTQVALDAHNRDCYTPDDEDYKDEPLSNPFLTRQQHTAVTQYVTNRSWTANSDTLTSDHMLPLRTPQRFLFSRDADAIASISRRSSIISQSLRRDFSAASQTLGPQRRSSSVSLEGIATMLSYPITPSGHQHQHRAEQRVFSQPFPVDQSISVDSGYGSTHKPSFEPSKPSRSKPDDYADQYREESQRMTNKIKGWFNRSKKDDQHTNVLDTRPAPIKTLAYNTTQAAPIPVPATTMKPIQPPPPTPSKTRGALLRGLSQKYTPKTSSQPQQAVRTQPHPSFSSSSSPLPSLHSTSLPKPHTHYSPPSSKPLPYPTKDPSCSDQGKFLAIGTMRALSPAGVDMLEGWMVRSMEKTGATEKGVKEIRKWLRGEDRATIEWVGEWLRERWGVVL